MEKITNTLDADELLPGIRMTTLWSFLRETSLIGKYPVYELLTEASDAAWFRTEFGPDQHSAYLKLVPEASPLAGEQQLEQWRAIAALSHPNLLPLVDYGRAAEDDGTAFLYAVFEFPDDTLAAGIEQGRLPAKEARDVLVAALEALVYIHSQGFVHGAVDANHVVAVGNQIKLTSDSLRLPSREATTTEDIRSLGALVYRLLTGRAVEPGIDPDATSVPEPFRTVIEHSLAYYPHQRWSLLQIAAATHQVPQEINSQPALSAPPAKSRTSESRSGAFPQWIYIATPAFLVALVLLLRGVKPKPEVPVPPRPPAAVQTSASPTSVAPTSAALGPVSANPSAPRSWRVIAYSFSRRGPAEKKAESINRQWSGAQAEVLVATGKRQMYVIAVGGPLTRDDASRFLKVARSKGMPRDSAIRNLP
jgi:eukaryotic-like serine/threonine-protein kinase